MIHFLKTLLATASLSAAVILPVASAQNFSSNLPTAQLYIANTSDIFSPVNIYLDGVLLASNVFNDGSPSTFARSVLVGRHQVVVMRNYQMLGQDDLLNTVVTVPVGGSTLTVAKNSTSDPSTGIAQGYEIDFNNTLE